MAEAAPSGRLQEIIEARVSLEKRLQQEKGEMAAETAGDYHRSYVRIQKELLRLFRDSSEPQSRIGVMLELIRILENQLVYLQNFVVDPTSENRTLATIVSTFLDQLSTASASPLSPLEMMYYRAIAALYAGDSGRSRQEFEAACASEESDEANDIKYKSYVILGHLSHDEHDYARARQLHQESLRYSSNRNVTAQAIAFKALNSYALGDYDEALLGFEESLTLFNPDEPFFNSYFFRNSILFCGSIHFDRRDFDAARGFYQRALENVERSSYDYFDALSHLGKIAYMGGDFEESARLLRSAVESQSVGENEYLFDTYFWLAKSELKRNRREEARACLEKITSSDLNDEKKSKAAELLQNVS